jgi:hypothetical protein
MTELEQARAHLRACQEALRRDSQIVGFVRTGTMSTRQTRSAWRDHMRDRKNAVLAALSWVWDAQEREREAKLDGECEAAIAAYMAAVAHDLNLPAAKLFGRTP